MNKFNNKIDWKEERESAREEKRCADCLHRQRTSDRLSIAKTSYASRRLCVLFIWC